MITYDNHISNPFCQVSIKELATLHAFLSRFHSSSWVPWWKKNRNGPRSGHRSNLTPWEKLTPPILGGEKYGKMRWKLSFDGRIIKNLSLSSCAESPIWGKQTTCSTRSNEEHLMNNQIHAYVCKIFFSFWFPECYTASIVAWAPICELAFPVTFKLPNEGQMLRPPITSIRQ
jgi:hypothetical protein